MPSFFIKSKYVIRILHGIVIKGVSINTLLWKDSSFSIIIILVIKIHSVL